MKYENRISKISIEGLHDQFDFDIKLNPGLNIIYGKNGRGKTTILHILANAFELDFRRFSHLRFRRIHISTFGGSTLDLSKDEGGAIPSVTINGKRTSFDHQNPVLSDTEIVYLREMFGERPTYLPAFRSVLERIKQDNYSYYRDSDPLQKELDEIMVNEYSSLRSNVIKNQIATPFENRPIREEANATARKTMQCRQWFGDFVPVIRYPSIHEVEDRLTEEWRTAHLELTRRERKMFEEIFVKVFKTISGIDKPPSTADNENLLASIESLLHDQEFRLESNDSSTIFHQLSQAAHQLTNGRTQQLQGIENSVLNLYREMLETRNNEWKIAFQSSRDFETSIKKFFDKKTLRIGPIGIGQRLRKTVSIGGESGHHYGITGLSSGEKQILTMLFSASRSRFSEGLFLIDEPELSLHIDWQRIILRELRGQSSDRQIIACTHSPEVGADHLDETQDFEPRVTHILQNSLFSDEDI